MTALAVRTDHCLNGWPSPKPCNWTGGCFCDRTRGHEGRCRCVCGSAHMPPAAGDDQP